MKQGDKYKRMNQSSSLTLPTNFSKFRDVESVREAYTHLQYLERSKAYFVMRAINYYDGLPERSAFLNNYKNSRRLFKRAVERFGVKNAADLKAILSMDKYTFGRYYLMSLKAPKLPGKSLFGFNVRDPEAVKMHARLCSMTVSERVMLITNAVNSYVRDGKDLDAEARTATRILKELYEEFHNAIDKDAFVEELLLMIR